MTEITEAVRQVEEAVLRDPVLGDMARVATARVASPLAGEIDYIAGTIRRELVEWSLSPARNPAPWVSFGVLVVHSDEAIAERLIRQLAATTVLSELPVVFRLGMVAPPAPKLPEPIDGEPSAAGQSAADQSASRQVDSIARLLFDAVHATASEVEQTSDFRVPVRHLRGLSLTPTVARMPAPTPSTSAAPQPRSVSPPPAVRDPGPVARWGRDDVASEPHPFAPHGLLGRMIGSVKGLLGEQRPAGHVAEVIDELNRGVDRLQTLYLVHVAQPTLVRRRDRERREDVAAALARAVMSRRVREPTALWFVRAFAAEERLRSADPLPASDRLDGSDFPTSWGEQADLHACAIDIEASIERDLRGFAQGRPLRDPRSVVVLLSGDYPMGDEVVEPTRRLCTTATVAWVVFAAEEPAVSDDLRAAGAHVLLDHEAVVHQTLRTAMDARGGPTPAVRPSGRHRAGDV